MLHFALYIGFHGPLNVGLLQELVERKLELVELSESYELLCHAFLKSDEAKNAPILAKLQSSGIVKPANVQINVRTG